MEGRRCDQCKENKYDRQRGCVDCPACYNLVQDAVASHRENLRKLEDVLKNINNNPTVIIDDDFEQKLKEVQSRVDELEQNAKFATGGMCKISLYLTNISCLILSKPCFGLLPDFEGLHFFFKYFHVLGVFGVFLSLVLLNLLFLFYSVHNCPLRYGFPAASRRSVQTQPDAASRRGVWTLRLPCFPCSVRRRRFYYYIPLV